MKKKISELFHNTNLTWSLLFFSVLIVNAFVDPTPSESSSFFLNLKATPTATITVTNTEFCLGEQTTITFEGADGNPNYSFTYTLNGGAEQTITTENSEISVTLDSEITASGTYTYSLIGVADSSDGGSITEINNQEITITVTDPPTVDFDFTNDNACSGETIQFTSNATGDGTLSYSWNFGDGTTSTLENPTKTYTAVGNGNQIFSVSLIVSDTNNCNTTIIKDIQVQRIPDIDFFSGSGTFVNCSDGSTNIFNLELFNNSASSAEITSYTIDWGDETAIETINGFPTNGSGLTHAYSIGIFTLSITATNINGCINSISYNISNGSNPGGAFETPGSTIGLCLPMDDIIFNEDPLGFHLIILDWGVNPINTTYSVDFGDGNIQNFTQQDLENSTFYNESNPDMSEGYKVYHSFTRGSCSEPNGEFIASLTITNDCGDTEFTIDSITVLEPSEALFDVPSNIECVNTPVEFENKTVIGDRSNCTKTARFTWDFGDGTFITTPFGTIAENQTHTYTTPGDYTVTLTVFGDCGSDTYQEDICIEPEIIASYDLNTQNGCIPLTVITENTIDESELCSEPIYNWSISYNNINCGTTEDWEFLDGTDSNSENPQFLFNNPGEYTLTQSIITNCGTFSTEKVINVKRPPTAAINPIANFCQPGTLTPIAIIENCTDNEDEVTYNWSFSGGTPATSSLQNPENISYDTAGTFEVTLTVTNECGVSSTATQQFAVLEKPIITNSPITQEICSNQSTEQISLTTNNTSSNFTWTATTVPNNPNITGFISNGTSQIIPGQTIVNNGANPGNVIFTVTPSLNGCLGDPVEVLTVIVNPTPTITTQPIGSDICLDGTANTLEVLTQNGVGTPTYQWYASTTNTYDLTNPIAGATNSTYDPATDTVGEIFYFVVISFEGGCSDIQSEIALVNTVPEPIATAVNPEQTICIDGQADTFTIDLVGGIGNPTYQWFSNTTNTNTGGTAIAGATNNNYDTGVLSTIGVFYYYIEVTLDGIGCDLAISDVFTVNVVQDPVIDTQPIDSQEICQNTTLEALEVSTSGDANTGDFSYQWFLNTTNSNTGGTAITGADTNVYNPDNTTVGTFFYYVVINQTASGCEVNSEVSTIIINEGPTITTQPIGSDICLDGTANTLEVLTQNGVGTPTYQWYASTTNTYDLTNPIAGATNSTYDPATDTVGEIFYFVVISFEGGCSDIQSEIALVNTVPEPTATAVNPEQTICVDGQADTFTIDLVGGLGNPTYQWFSNTTNSNTGGTAIAGATNNNYDTGVLSTIGVFYYYIEVTLDGIGCDLAISDVFTVNVVQDPVIDTQPIDSQEICQNTTLEALEVSTSGDANTGDFSYQWFLNTTNSNTGGTAITGADTNVYNPDNTTVGTFFYYVVINQTASGCEVNSEVSTIIINEGPTITTQPIGSDICLDGTANTLEVLTQNGVGTPTYQWYASTTNTYDLTNPIAGATNSTYDPATDTVGEIFYFVVISFEGGCSDIQSEIALVNTNQIPIIDFAQITIYSEETFLFEPSSVAGNIVPTGTTYTWTTPTSSSPGAILGSSAESSSQTNISQTLENTDIFPVIETYIITPATPNCVGNNFILEVTVNPKIISNVLVTNNTCYESNDGNITTNITGGVPFTSGSPYLISWTGPNSFNSTASIISNLIAGIYILRIEDSNGVSITEQYTVTQPGLLTITTDLEKNISCFDGSDGAIEVSISGGTLSYTFNWTTTDGTGIIQGNKDQNGLTAGTYNIEVTDGNQCVTTKTFILTEPQAIAISTVLKEDILCFGDATGAIEIVVTGGTPIEVSSGVFGYNYSWTGPDGFTSNDQNISNLFAGTYTIEITDDLNCVERAEIILTEPTAIEIDYTKTDATCYGATDGSIDVTVTGGRPPYQISWSNLGNGFSQSNLSAGNYTVTIVDENQCEANVIITIEQPIFFIAPVVKPISCNNANDASIDLNLTGGIAPITVLWSDDPSAGIQRNNLGPGTYVVTIIDSDINQCPIEETFIITNPPAIAVTSIVTDAIDCNIENSGSILLDVSGGTPPYDFMWNTGQTTEDLNNIPAGDYTVEIRDKNDCIEIRQFSIFRQDPINITFNETLLSDCVANINTVENTPIVIGGFLPYTFSWSAGITSGANNETMTTDQSGAYTLTITDGQGCIETATIQVDVPPIGTPDFSYSSFALTQYGFISIDDPIQFTNLTTGSYSSFSWDFGDGSPVVNTLNPIHTYDEVGSFRVTLTVVYESGCVLKIGRTLNITLGYSLVLPNAFTPNDDGINDFMRPIHRGFTEIEMSIYDTWGALVYYEKGISLKGWDGLIAGSPAENGNYILDVKGLTFYERMVKDRSSITLLK
jgi:gliding motility-associated-like protein